MQSSKKSLQEMYAGRKYNPEPYYEQKKEVGVEKITYTKRPSYKWASEVLKDKDSKPRSAVSPLLQEWLDKKQARLEDFKKADAKNK